MTVESLSGDTIGTATLTLPNIRNDAEFVKLLMSGTTSLRREWNNAIMVSINKSLPMTVAPITTLAPPPAPTETPLRIVENKVLLHRWKNAPAEAKWMLAHAVSEKPPPATLVLVAVADSWKTRQKKFLARLAEACSTGATSLSDADRLLAMHYFPGIFGKAGDMPLRDVIERAAESMGDFVLVLPRQRRKWHDYTDSFIRRQSNHNRRIIESGYLSKKKTHAGMNI